MWFKGIVRIEWHDAAGKLVKTTRCAVPINKISPWIHCDDTPVHTQLLNWMSEEIATNLQSPEFREIQINHPERLIEPVPLDLSRKNAWVLWSNQVRPDGPWDHKKFIIDTYGASSYSLDKGRGRYYFQWYDTRYLLSHDFWSNFHYGYVGRAAGFLEPVLRGAHQVAGAGGTDDGDRLTVNMGIAYFAEHGPGGVDPAALDSFLRRYTGQLLGTGVVKVIPYRAEAPAEGLGPAEPRPDAPVRPTTPTRPDAPQPPRPGSDAITTWVSVLTPNGSAGPKVLDVKDGSRSDGARVQLWQRNGNQQQYWTMERKGTYQGHSYYQLVNRRSGKCLDMATDVPAGNGVRVQQWQCNGTPNQHWAAVPVESGSRGKWVELVNLHSGRCLDVTGVNHADGALLQVWDCAGGWNQRFNIY